MSDFAFKIPEKFRDVKGVRFSEGKNLKRKISPTLGGGLNLVEKTSKRIQLKPTKALIEASECSELASKSTVASCREISSPKNNDLSAETRSVISQILQKAGKKPKGTQTRVFSNENTNNRFSVSSSPKEYEMKQPKIDEVAKELGFKKPPELSSRAKEIIAKLKNERVNKFYRDSINKPKDIRSDSSFSLRYKYEELLQRQLPLPTKYKSLLNSFISLDQVINLNKIRSVQQVNTFENIQKSIESSTHRRFDMTIFRQILFVVPHLFIYKYEKKANFDVKVDYDLIIDIPSDYDKRLETKYSSDFDFKTIQYFQSSDFNPITTPIPQSETNKRINEFRQKLYQIIADKHQHFLANNNLKGFNPFKGKSWHHDFDLEKIEDIPGFIIVPKPTATCVFQKLINENDIKSQILKDALSNIKEDDIEMKDNPQSEITNELSKYASKNFMQKILAKEKAAKETKEIYEYNKYMHSKKNMSELYVEIMKQIKTFFVITKQGNFELGELSKKVLDSSKLIKESYNKEKIAQIILKLSKKFPDLLIIKKHSSAGCLVLMNVKKDIPSEIQLDDE